MKVQYTPPCNGERHLHQRLTLWCGLPAEEEPQQLERNRLASETNTLLERTHPTDSHKNCRTEGGSSDAPHAWTSRPKGLDKPFSEAQNKRSSQARGTLHGGLHPSPAPHCPLAMHYRLRHLLLLIFSLRVAPSIGYSFSTTSSLSSRVPFFRRSFCCSARRRQHGVVRCLRVQTDARTCAGESNHMFNHKNNPNT